MSAEQDQYIINNLMQQFVSKATFGLSEGVPEVNKAATAMMTNMAEVGIKLVSSQAETMVGKEAAAKAASTAQNYVNNAAYQQYEKARQVETQERQFVETVGKTAAEATSNLTAPFQEVLDNVNKAVSTGEKWLIIGAAAAGIVVLYLAVKK